MTEVEDKPPDGAAADPMAVVRSRAFLVLILFSAVIGIVASLAAWCFLQAIHWTSQYAYTDLPESLGFDHAPQWWSLPLLALAGLVVAFAVARLPGRGGHIPADGLSAGTLPPIDLPGVLLASIASVGLGVVLGPEAPLIAIGGGVGLIAVKLARRDAEPQVGLILGAAGMFAAVSFLFGSPLVAAVIIIEASGLGGPRAPLILVPGLVAAGIGSLVSTGMASFTGLSTSDIAIGPLKLAEFTRPDFGDICWAILLAIVVALATFLIFRLARWVLPIVTRRPFLLLPIAGLLVSGSAIAFSELSDKGVDQVLFSGEDQLPGLVAHADQWSLSALALLILFKGFAWSISLSGFRGGPTFPAMYLGAAGGLMAAHLSGVDLTPAVAVGISASVAAVLRLPLSAAVLTVVITAGTAGSGSVPLVIVAAAVAYITISVVAPKPTGPQHGAPAAAAA
jgi:H+/Cl- antiporter ClcA